MPHDELVPRVRNAAAMPAGPRELGTGPDRTGPDGSLRERSQDALRDRSGGRRWEVNPSRQSGTRTPSRQSGMIVKQGVATSRPGSYGAQIIQRTAGSRFGSIVRLSR